jgi:hypothetical protein
MEMYALLLILIIFLKVEGIDSQNIKMNLIFIFLLPFK